jgi:hypothetical protein
MTRSLAPEPQRHRQAARAAICALWIATTSASSAKVFCAAGRASTRAFHEAMFLRWAMSMPERLPPHRRWLLLVSLRWRVSTEPSNHSQARDRRIIPDGLVTKLENC